MRNPPRPLVGAAVAVVFPPWQGGSCPLAKPRGGAPIGATCSVHALAGVRAPLAKGRCAHRRSARRFTVSGAALPLTARFQHWRWAWLSSR